MKNVVSIAMTLVVLLVMGVPSSYAVEIQSVDTVGAQCIKDGAVSVRQGNDETYEIEINSTRRVDPSPRQSLSGESTYELSSLKILAYSLEEKDMIIGKIETIKSGKTLTDDDWFLGSSCYIYISVTYSTRTGANGLKSRVDSVKTQCRVLNGTYVSSATLYMGATGTSEEIGSCTYSDELNITSTPTYSTSRMSQWPYIYNASAQILGASFEVTAKRPSGSSETHSVTAHVFYNM